MTLWEVTHLVRVVRECPSSHPIWTYNYIHIHIISMGFTIYIYLDLSSKMRKKNKYDGYIPWRIHDGTGAVDSILHVTKLPNSPDGNPSTGLFESSTSWWLNFPTHLKNMRTSKWVHQTPNFSGWNFPKIMWVATTQFIRKNTIRTPPPNLHQGLHPRKLT